MRPIVVLSPHRDDAAFSLFICLTSWSRSPSAVTVQNFFTRSAYAPQVREKDSGAITGIRRREDRQVLRRISPRIEVRDEELLDAPLRLAISASVVCHDETQALLSKEDVLSIVSRIQSKRPRIYLAPLALGNHIDHKVVQRAAIQSAPAGSLAFYEDLPYKTWTSEAALRERIGDLEQGIREKLHPLILRVPHAAAWKRRVTAGYRSQIAPAEAANLAHWANKHGGGERLWLTSPLRRELRALSHQP